MNRELLLKAGVIVGLLAAVWLAGEYWSGQEEARLRARYVCEGHARNLKAGTNPSGESLSVLQLQVRNCISDGHIPRESVAGLID